MTLYDFFRRFKIFSKIFDKDSRAEEMMTKNQETRKGLNQRLENVTRATLDGETEWFLALIKDDPSCALDVLKECKAKDDS